MAALPGISPSTIRIALKSAGIAVAQPWAGIEQHTFDELERSLLDMASAYLANAELRQQCRNVVIEAKDRARWTSKSPRVDEETRTRKAEMVEWMLVWLADPAMFETWAALRKQARETTAV